MFQFFVRVGAAIVDFYTKYQTVINIAALTIQGIQAHRTNKKLKKGQDILLTKFGTGSGIPVVYGTRRVAGTVVFMETVANKELFVVYALAVGEVENISDLRIDGRSINDVSVYRQGYVLRKEGNYFGGTVASENTVDIGNVLGGAGGDNPRMVFNLHHGATDQEADPMLYHVFDGTNSRPNSWSQEHKLSGIAYIAANYEYDTQGMFSGIPNLTAVVKGKKVLDTRTSTTGWSDNPALILYDYLTNDEYGKGIATSKIDTTSFNTAANDCETDVQTITHSNVEVTSASTTTDRVILADGADFDKIKTGTTISFVANSTTYFSGKVIDKDNTNFLYDAADNYARRFTLTLADGAVTTAITSSTTGTITETQDRFETNAVIDTDESVLENTKDLVANMRGIFNYTNGTYSIKVEGTETPVLNLDEDDILEAGIELSLENKEQKYNKVEVEFYNSSKNYEADTVVVEHSPLSDDGSELLEHRVQFPHVTNQRIAYNHANAILNRSRNNRTISFVATPKVLKAKVGEVITITSSDLGLSQEQYRITQMTIQPDLNIQVSAVEYQGSIYGWNDPPEEPIETPELPPDPYRVEQVTNLNFVQKSGSTPAYLSWTDADGYTSFEFAVKVYDSTNQSGNVIRDGRVKETRFYLPELPKANGYSAEVISINTLGIESDSTPLNTFNVTVDPVITEDIAQGAVGGFKFTGSKMYHPVDGSDTGTFETSNVYIDDTGQFSLKDKLSFDGTDLTVQGDITSGSTITGATITIDTSASIRKFKASTSLVEIGSGIDEPQLRIATGNVTNALTFASESGEDGDKVSFALDNGGTITEKAFIKTDTGNASFQNLTFNGNLISGSTTVISSARQLQNIASLDSTTTTTIQNAVGGGTGDITAVTAGTNLTGGGTTGDVTLNLATNLSGLGTISSGAITSTGNYTLQKNIPMIRFISADGSSNSYSISGNINNTVDGGFYIQEGTTNGTNVRLSIDASGDVGIGKINASQKLDVDGNIGISGTEIVTSARALTNIGTISSGAITSSGDITANSGFVKIAGSSASEGGELQLLRGTSGTTDINIDNYQNYLRVHSGGSVWLSLTGSLLSTNQISSTGGGSASSPTLALNSSTSTTFNHAINAFNSNLTSGENNVIIVGKAGSTKNSGYIGYKWNGAGGNNNLVTFGHWGNDNLMNLTGDGKLGIGTQSPRHTLSVNGTLGSSTFSGFGMGVIGGLATAESGNTNRVIGIQSHATSNAKLFAYDYGASAGIPISIQPDNADVYLCAGGGEVGIGTTNPTSALDVRGSVGGGGILRLIDSNSTECSIGYKIGGATGNVGWVAGNYNNNFFIYSYSLGSQAMTIKPTGEVGINNANPPQKLTVNGNIGVSGTEVIDSTRNFKNIASLSMGDQILRLRGSADSNHFLQFTSTGYSGVTIDGPHLVGYQGGELGTKYIGGNQFALRWDTYGNVTVRSNITAYSDGRLKDNIQTLDGSKVFAMRGVSFTKDNKAGSGVIAQEIEKIAPELVDTSDDAMGTKSVAYGNLVGYLIEAIKELKAEIEELKKA